MEPQVLDGRDCGSCNVCCVMLTIDDPELQKPQGYRCRNAQRDNSCAIYETRPNTCRAFNCGWRVLRFVRPTLRPDQSGVLVRMHREVSAKTGEGTMGIIVTLLNTAALKAEGLAETLAAAVSANVPVFLSVPGPPGFTSGIARINEALADAVAFKDKPGLLAILRQAYRKGRTGDHAPIRLTPHPPPAARSTDPPGPITPAATPSPDPLADGETVPLLPIHDRLQRSAERLEATQAVSVDEDHTTTR